MISNNYVITHVSSYCMFSCFAAAADDSKERREMVRRKTSEYLLYAENLQQKILSKDSKVETAESQVPAPSNAKPHHLQDFKVKAILGRVNVTVCIVFVVF